MATLKVNGNSYDVPDGKKLNIAIEKIAGVDILHRCGGNAKCTTCRVTFNSGEPGSMTDAEKGKLESNDAVGEYRLSCQIVCTDDMEVEAIMTLESEGWSDTGPELSEEL